MVFIVFGPLLVATMSLTLTSKIDLDLLLLAIPISFLVTALVFLRGRGSINAMC